MNPNPYPVSGRKGDNPSLTEDVSGVIRSALAVLRRRYLTLCGVTAVVFGLFVILFMLMTPRYQAIARVKIDPKPTAMNGVGADQAPALPDQYVVDTEASAMLSRDIALAVIQRLSLDHDPEFTKTLAKNPKLSINPDTRMNEVLKAVSRNLSVSREKLTYIIDVSFKSVDPYKAALIANTYADAYIQATIARRTHAAEQQFAWLDKRLETLASQARSADTAVAQYKASNGLTEGGQFGTITDQQVAPLSSQLATAEATAAAARSDLAVAKQQMASGGAAAASSVLNSPAIQALRASHANVEQTLSQIRSRYGPDHPQTLQAKQQLSAIDQQIAQEATRIVGELTAKSRAADAQSDSLRSGVAQLRGEQAANARASVSADALTRDADAKHSAYNRAAEDSQQLEQGAQSSASQAQVIERAAAPENPSEPKALKILGAGFLLGLIAGLAIVVVQELLMPGFAVARDIEMNLGIKVLSSAPLLSRKELASASATSPAEALLARPMSPYAEAFRVVRSTLLISQPQPKVIALVSSLPGEGKTTSALSLARIMALSGERTLLIDCDVRQSGLGKLIAERPAKGLVEALKGEISPSAAILADSAANLDIMTSAEASFVTTDLFGGTAFSNLLDEMRGRYERIVLDTPPLFGVAEARTLAATADAVILVVKWNRTPRSIVGEAVEWLHMDKAALYGAMMTMVSPKAESFGSVYYSRAYANYYKNA